MTNSEMIKRKLEIIQRILDCANVNMLLECEKNLKEATE